MTTLLQNPDSKSTTHCWWAALFCWEKHTVHTIKHTRLTMNHEGCYLGHSLRFCSISFVTLGSARESLQRSSWNASASLLLPLGNIKREMGWRGEIKGRERGGILVAMSVKCQNVLADCSFLTRPLDSRGAMGGIGGGGQRGWWERVLLKAVKGTDKEISFVILSGGGKKKERDSDFEDVLPPYNQRGKGKRKSSGKAERHLKTFPGFAFYECRGEREGKRQRITDGVELVASLIIRGGEKKVLWAQKGTTHRERKRDAVFADDPSLSTVTTKDSHHLEECGFHFLFLSANPNGETRTDQRVWYFLSPCSSLVIQTEFSSFLKQSVIVVFGAKSAFVGDKVFSRRMIYIWHASQCLWQQDSDWGIESKWNTASMCSITYCKATGILAFQNTFRYAWWLARVTCIGI